MLSWAVRRGFQGATGATDAPEDAEYEAPDTPAPVFAARAIRNAIFGTPAAPRDPPPEATATTTRVELQAPVEAPSNELKSPTKSNGILLTPGTGTAKRKRVSFGRDVKSVSNGDSLVMSADGSAQGRKKTALQQAMEKSRATKAAKTQDPGRAETTKEDKAVAKPTKTEPAGGESDSSWEDDACSRDVTVDLNEPHSRSGKYWQSQFNKYSEDARNEMAKLVKYKHLAKKYAEKKDAETVAIGEKLREQQEVVAQMEKKLKSLEAQVAQKRQRGAGTDDALLAENAALTKKYQGQVKELEALLKANELASDINTSPRAASTPHELQRELRRAKSDLREMKGLRDEVTRLRSQLKVERQRTEELGEEKKKLREASNASQHAFQKLKEDYDMLKENAKSQRSQALQVLSEKNSRIAELEEEVEALKAKDKTQSRTRSLDIAATTRARVARSLKADVEALDKPLPYESTKTRHLPKRSVSADDVTLDLDDDTRFRPNGGSPKSWRNARDFGEAERLLEIEQELEREKKEQMEARKRERYSGDDGGPPAAKRSDNLSSYRTSTRPRRTAPEVLTNRANNASLPAGASRSDRRLPSSRTARNGDEVLMHGALDSTTNPRKPYTTKSHAVSTSGGGGDASGVDLLENRFARLGGSKANDTVLTANTSRCALPDDRKAAALARLQRKRQTTTAGGGGGRNKENLRT